MELKNFKIVPQWSHSKEEIWASTFEPLAEVKPMPRFGVVRISSVVKFAVAAIFAGAILLTSFAAFYTQTFETQRGNHYTLFLPDNSRVELNAETSLSYKPFWWRVSRSVAMNGEAYFEVQKGSDFTVRCNAGVVKVLGTKFNVKSRAGEFKVTCITGKVSVKVSNQSVILAPDMEAKVVGESFTSAPTTTANEVVSWTKNHFNFTNCSLESVLQEIERQYNIRIRRPAKIDYFYTGNFFKTTDPKEVLDIVGKPYGLSLEIDN